MLCLAQVNDAVKEFKHASETWGLATTVLLSLLILVMVGLGLIALWLKPKFDAAFTAHLNLVSSLGLELPKISGSVVSMEEAMKHQSECIDQQTESVEKMAAKIEEWPSDAHKLCQAEMALKAAGFNPRTIAKLMELQRRQRERDREKDEGVS